MNDDEPSDADLLARATAGERAAFAALLERHVPTVRRFLGRLGARAAEIDDLAQEVFVAILRNLESKRAGTRFSTWLYGIAVNVERAARRRRRFEALPAEPVEPPMESTVDRADEVAALHAALDALPETLRAAFVLRHVERLPVEDAARALDVPEGTLKRWTFEARERLRAALQPAEGTP